MSAEKTPPARPSAAILAPQPAAGVPRTRFVIGLSKSAKFEVFSLPNPNRVIVDVADVSLRLPEQPTGAAASLVRAFYGGPSVTGQSRIVLDVTVPVIVEKTKIETARDGKITLNIDIAPIARQPAPNTKRAAVQAPFALGAADVQPPTPRLALPPSVRAAKTYKPVVVLDPGHGGHDSGAMKNGAVEKEVVLRFAQLLRKKLEATGQYRVVMTRDDDTFVELGERLAIGDRNKASLFIAIHADYAGKNANARGATIYSLRDSVANSLKKSAKGEVSKDMLADTKFAAVDDSDLTAVKSMLSSVDGNVVAATHDRTNFFSRAVTAIMGSSTTMRNDPEQTAAFKVLKTAKFPSVLIELAYVTNKEDADNLMSDAWREKVSDSIMTAVGNYFGDQAARMPL